jgi:GNAT superfamily N-acetyltransferase
MVLGQWLAAVAPAASDDLFDFASPTSSFYPALLVPGGAVRAAQREAADEEDNRPQKVGQPRALDMQDAEAFYQLTRLQRWDNTLEDLHLLLSMEGSRAFGIFSGSAQLVAVCACTHLPEGNGGGGGVAWLSYVITRKDFRRRGLARQTCTAALEWLDGAYPGCPIGLYGEPTKAAPLYTELGFRDVGNARFWSGSFSADAILAADMSSSSGANGKRAVNSRVRAITVGASTALTAGKGSVLLESLLIGDERVLGCSRAQALRAWQKETPFLSWEVPDVDRALVARIFGKFCDKTSGRMMYQGLRDLNFETVGMGVQEKEYEAFCRRVGVSPAEGFSEDALFEIYAQPGNSVTYDAGVLFEGAAGPRMQMAGGAGGGGGRGSSPARGWVLGRRTAAAEGGSGYFIGPLVARDAECATALLIAALRGAAADHKLRHGLGQFKVELLGVEAPGMAQAEASLVLESLGFKAGGQSRYMVRGSAGKIYPEGGSRIIAASSFEYA